MPAIPKTTRLEVVRAARRLVEHFGAPALSMQGVAESVGVRAPSLYKRFPDRESLLDAVAEDALVDLQRALTSADGPSSDVGALAAMAHVYRDFAKRFPRLYPLLFIDRKPATGPSAGTLAAVQPVLNRLQRLVGPEHTLPAARLLVSFLHGFVSMEIAGAFRLGGDIDEAFEFSVSTVLRALTPRGRMRERSHARSS